MPAGVPALLPTMALWIMASGGRAAPTHMANHLCRATGFADTRPAVGLRRPRIVVCGNHNAVPTSGSYGTGGGPHDIGTEFIRQLLSESQKVRLAHTKAREGLIKARAGPGGTMAWALRELQLHQQAERQGVPRATLN